MGKKFTDKEKNIIGNQLMEQGKYLFSTYGIKKTSISDITKAVGIAQGSFYTFYDSKEELYFDILEMEERTIKEKILKDFNIFDADAKSFKNFLLAGLKALDDNPFLQTLYNTQEYELLIRKLPEEKLQNHKDNDGNDLAPLIELWKSQGKIRNYDLEAITGVIRSLFILAIHKKEIGSDVYEKTQELLVTLIANGLFIGGERND